MKLKTTFFISNFVVRDFRKKSLHRNRIDKKKNLSNPWK